MAHKIPRCIEWVSSILRLHVRDDLKRTWASETRLDRQEKKLEGTTPQLTGKYAAAH